MVGGQGREIGDNVAESRYLLSILIINFGAFDRVTHPFQERRFPSICPADNEDTEVRALATNVDNAVLGELGNRVGARIQGQIMGLDPRVGGQRWQTRRMGLLAEHVGYSRKSRRAGRGGVLGRFSEGGGHT